MLWNGTQLFVFQSSGSCTVECLVYCLDRKHKADGKTKLTRNVLT
jgi:hypothetical protein